MKALVIDKQYPNNYYKEMYVVGIRKYRRKNRSGIPKFYQLSFTRNAAFADIYLGRSQISILKHSTMIDRLKDIVKRSHWAKEFFESVYSHHKIYFYYESGKNNHLQKWRKG